MEKLDAKFYGEIRKVKDDSVVPEDQWMVFLAKDQAFYSTLCFYKEECIRLGADAEHIASIERTIARLAKWQIMNSDKVKVPDAHGDKLLG